MPVPAEESDVLEAVFLVVVVDFAGAYFVVDFTGAFFAVGFAGAFLGFGPVVLAEAGDDVKNDRISEVDFTSFAGRVPWFS